MIPCIQDSLTPSILTEKNRSKHFIIIWQTSPIMWELMRTDSFIRIKMSKNREFLLMPIRPEGVMDSILMMWIWIIIHYIIPVKEFFFQSVIIDFHITASIKSCDFFSETTIQDAIFQCNYRVMVCLQLLQQSLIQSGKNTG